jgi:hypothetical protein
MFLHVACTCFLHFLLFVKHRYFTSFDMFFFSKQINQIIHLCLLVLELENINLSMKNAKMKKNHWHVQRHFCGS